MYLCLYRWHHLMSYNSVTFYCSTVFLNEKKCNDITHYVQFVGKKFVWIAKTLLLKLFYGPAVLASPASPLKTQHLRRQPQAWGIRTCILTSSPVWEPVLQNIHNLVGEIILWTAGGTFLKLRWEITVVTSMLKWMIVPERVRISMPPRLTFVSECSRDCWLS